MVDISPGVPRTGWRYARIGGLRFARDAPPIVEDTIAI
jgi:hypothetical protein